LDGLCLSNKWKKTKMPQKEITNVEEKKKIKLMFVLGKEEKGFDIEECQLKDEIISDEYFSSFPLRFTLVKDVLLPITKFKKAPLDIVYHPFSMAPHEQNKNLYYVLQQVSHKGSNFHNSKGFKEIKWHFSTCPNEVGGNPRFGVSYYWWVAHDCCNKGKSLQF